MPRDVHKMALKLKRNGKGEREAWALAHWLKKKKRSK